MRLTRVENGFVYWYSIPDYTLLNEKGKPLNGERFDTWSSVYDRWMTLGKPRNHSIRCERTQSRQVLRNG